MGEVYIFLNFFDSGNLRGHNVVPSLLDPFFYFYRDMIKIPAKGERQ